MAFPGISWHFLVKVPDFLNQRPSPSPRFHQVVVTFHLIVAVSAGAWALLSPSVIHQDGEGIRLSCGLRTGQGRGAFYDQYHHHPSATARIAASYTNFRFVPSSGRRLEDEAIQDNQRLWDSCCGGSRSGGSRETSKYHCRHRSTRYCTQSWLDIVSSRRRRERAVAVEITLFDAEHPSHKRRGNIIRPMTTVIRTTGQRPILARLRVLPCQISPET